MNQKHMDETSLTKHMGLKRRENLEKCFEFSQTQNI